MSPLVLLLSWALLALPLTTSSDWPGYRGDQVAGRSADSLTSIWPSGGPTSLWRVKTPSGFSSFAVADGRAFTLILRNLEGVDREVCLALDASSGRELWATPVGIAKYDSGGNSGTQVNRGGDGPRSTPASDGRRVYVFTAQLNLIALDAATGAPVWSRDLIRQHQGRNISWQNAASPVLDDGRLFVAGGGPGESLLAVRCEDGSVHWKTGDETLTHATPVVATLLGVRQIIFFTRSGLVSLNTETGEPLWDYPVKFRTSTAASPVVADPVVFCSAGYGVGGAAVRIVRSGDHFSAVELWRKKGDRDVASHWSTPVHDRGHLYGLFSFKKYGSGPLKCVEITTGRILWEQDGFGAGNVILAQDQLLALSDAGELVLIEASPGGYHERARAKVLEGKCWSTPAVANGQVFVRSTEEGACFDLSLPKTPD